MIPLGVLASGYVAPAGGGGDVTYLGYDFISTDTTTYTFTDQPLGTPSTNRHIIVAGAARWPSTGTVTSVTVAGVSATVTQIEVPTYTNLWFAVASVPAGATGSVVVTYTLARARCAIALWSAASEPTIVDTAHNGRTNDSARSVTLSTASGGHALAVILAVDADAGTFAWTGATERFDYSNTGEASGWSGADVATTGSDVTITADWSPAGASAEDLYAISLSF